VQLVSEPVAMNVRFHPADRIPSAADQGRGKGSKACLAWSSATLEWRAPSAIIRTWPRIVFSQGETEPVRPLGEREDVGQVPTLLEAHRSSPTPQTESPHVTKPTPPYRILSTLRHRDYGEHRVDLNSKTSKTLFSVSSFFALCLCSLKKPTAPQKPTYIGQA